MNRLNRSVLRSSVLTLLVMITAFLAMPSLAAAGETSAIIRTRAVDSVTGGPAVGAEWALYRRESNGVWSREPYGDVASDGSIQWEVVPAGTFALYIDGRSGYSDVLYGSTQAVPELATGTGSLAKWPVVGPPEIFDHATRIVVRDGDVTTLPPISLQPTPTPYGAIVGQVTERETGAGVGSGFVRAYRFDEAAGSWTRLSLWIQPQGSGIFRLVGTAAEPLTGDVRVGFEELGYRVSSGWFPAADDVQSGRTLHVLSGQTVYGADIGVTVDGKLGGELFWADTKLPVKNGQIDIDSPGGGGDTGIVGASGAWMLMGMTPGQYTLAGFQAGELDHPKKTYYGQSATTAGSIPVVLPEVGSVWDLDIWLSEGPALAGKVRDGAGHPITDVVVTGYRLESGNWKAVGSDYTDAGGRYAITCPEAGTYTLRFADIGGTTDAGDDAGIYLGGTATLATASRISVSAKNASVADVRMATRDGVRARRTGAATPFDLALDVSRESYTAGSCTSAVLASGEDIDYALCAPGLAAAVHGPMLLTRSIGLYPGLLAELDRIGAHKVYVLGPATTISTAQSEFLVALGFDVERITGTDPYDLSASVARTIATVSTVTSETPVFVVNGANSADALAVAPAATASKGIVFLARATGAPTSVIDAVELLGISNIVAVGSPTALPTPALAGLEAAGVDVTRCPSGADAYANAAKFATFARERGWLADTDIGIARKSEHGDALIAATVLGASRGALLYTARTTLPQATEVAIGDSALDRRIRVFGDPTAVTSSVLVKAGSALRQVSVTKPSAPSAMRRGRTYTVSGYIRPQQAAGSRVVRIYLWRRSGGKWRSRGYVAATVADYSAPDSSYAARVKLTQAGKWRLRAYHVADSVFASAWSSTYRNVTVK